MGGRAVVEGASAEYAEAVSREDSASAGQTSSRWSASGVTRGWSSRRTSSSNSRHDDPRWGPRRGPARPPACCTRSRVLADSHLKVRLDVPVRRLVGAGVTTRCNAGWRPPTAHDHRLELSLGREDTDCESSAERDGRAGWTCGRWDRSALCDTGDGVRHLRQRALLLGWRFRDTPFEGAGELVAGVGGTLGSAGSENVREATAESARGPHVFLVPDERTPGDTHPARLEP